MGVVLYCLDRRSILEKPERQWRAEGKNVTLVQLVEHPGLNRVIVGSKLKSDV